LRNAANPSRASSRSFSPICQIFFFLSPFIFSTPSDGLSSPFICVLHDAILPPFESLDQGAVHSLCATLETSAKQTSAPVIDEAEDICFAP